MCHSGLVGVRGQLAEATSLFSHCPEYQAEVVMLGGKGLHLLRHLTGYMLCMYEAQIVNVQFGE